TRCPERGPAEGWTRPVLLPYGNGCAGHTAGAAPPHLSPCAGAAQRYDDLTGPNFGLSTVAAWSLARSRPRARVDGSAALRLGGGLVRQRLPARERRPQHPPWLRLPGAGPGRRARLPA